MRRHTPLTSAFAFVALMTTGALGRDTLTDDGSATDQYWRPEQRVQSTDPREPDLDINALGAGGGLVIPRFDIDGECRASHSSNLAANECIRSEQAAYNNVRSAWDVLSIDAKTKCREIHTYQTVRYRRIQACVSGELERQDVKALRQNRLKFDYGD